MTNEVTVPKPQKSEVGQMWDALREIALDKDTPPEKLNALLDVQERIIKFKREEEFNRDWALLMKDLSSIKFFKNKKVEYDKEKNNPKAGKVTAFKFCPLGNVDKEVRPLMLKYGFHPSYTTEPRAGDGGGIVMTATILHEGGHAIKTVLPMPLDASGGKTNAQGMGSSVSYAWRNCLRMMLNIICIDDDEDDDGQGGAPKKIDVPQVEQLRKLLQETAADEAGFLKFMGVEKIEDIWVINFQQAVVSLNAKKSRAVKS